MWVLLSVEQTAHILSKPLQRFGLYLTLLSVERIVVEVFRINPEVLWRLSEAQVIGIALCLSGILMIIVSQVRYRAQRV